MKPFFTLVLLFASFICQAQKLQNVYFLKNDGRYLKSQKEADFIRIVSQPDLGDSLYNVVETYLNGARKLVGKSKTPEVVHFDGVVTTYYANGNQKAIYNYKKNAFVGEQSEFFPNGKLYIVKKYNDDGEINSDLRAFLIIANYDSLGNALATNGNGLFKLYKDDFTEIIEEGSVKDGYKDGKITGHNGDNQYVEIYRNGKFIDGTSTNKGKSVQYKEVMATLPQYPGGISAFGEYLGTNIKYPQEERMRNSQGRVVLKFIVGKDGELSDFTVLKSAGKAFDNEALRVLKASPKWTPGTMRGDKVRATFTVPINFALH